MNAGAAAVLALVVGLMLGAFTVWFLIRRAAAEPVDELAEPNIEVPAGVREVLAVLGSPAVVVGPHDELLESNTQARNSGIARGNRIVVSELVDSGLQLQRGRLRPVDPLVGLLELLVSGVPLPDRSRGSRPRAPANGGRRPCRCSGTC